MTFVEHLLILRRVENEAFKLQVKRLDIVLNTYTKYIQLKSIKSATREERGNEAVAVLEIHDTAHRFQLFFTQRSK